jgi:hypothetical protein
MDWPPAELERAVTRSIMNTIAILHRALSGMNAQCAPHSRAHFASLEARMIFVRSEPYSS